MLELAIKGTRRYWGWIGTLAAIFGGGFLVYLYQLQFGLGITGLSRDVSWGLIADIALDIGIEDVHRRCRHPLGGLTQMWLVCAAIKKGPHVRSHDMTQVWGGRVAEAQE